MEPRNFKAGAAESPPSAPVTPSNGYATEGNPATGTPATLPGAFWFHKIGEELRAVITGFGLTPSDSTLNQVYLAIQAGIAANIQPAAAVSGNVSGFAASAIGINNYNCTVAGKEAVLENGSNFYLTVRAFSKTINANGPVGAPLSIMSALAASTWYYRWLWYNVTNGLTATLDISSTAPTAPTGYISTDYRCLLPGACRTDASGSKYLLQINTANDLNWYIPLASSNTPNLPQAAACSSTVGSTSIPTFVDVGLANFIPPGAVEVGLLDTNPGATPLIIAASHAYGAWNSTTNPCIIQGGNSGNYFCGSRVSKLMLEIAQQISWAAVGVAAINIYSWR